MKKIVLFLGIIGVFCLNAMAQNTPESQNKTELRFGLLVGANFANMQLDDVFAYEGTLWDHDLADVKQKMHVGLRAGGLFEAKFNKTLSLQAELLYSQTGFNQDYKYTDVSGVWNCKSKTSVHSISLGLMAKIWPAKWISIDLGAQPEINVSVIKKTNKTLEENSKMLIKKSENYAKEGYNAFSVNLLGGLTFYVGESLFFQVRYNHGLLNVLKGDAPYYQEYEDEHSELKHSYSNATSKSRVVQATIGFIF